MATKQELVQQVIEIIRPLYDPDGDPDEFGMNFRSKDGLTVAHLTSAGISFSNAANQQQYAAYGLSHQKDIRNFIKNPSVVVETPKEATKPSPKEHGPSARGLIFAMLDAGVEKTQEALQEEILASLIKQHPDRDPKKLKTQIYLHRSEWNRKQKGAK